jgi:TolB-like protein
MQWADVYDRDIEDIFAVEDEIADAIVASVSPMAGPGRANPS